MLTAHMVLDLQFGSTGKGLLCGYLANKHKYDTVISAWGPNAGHTFIDERGAVYVNTMLPIGAVIPGVKNVLLGPGSVLDLEALHAEIRNAVSQSGPVAPRFNLIIHPMAMVQRQRHRDAEKELMRVGSTMKGTGAAVVEKVWRDPSKSPIIRDAVRSKTEGHIIDEFIERCGRVGIMVVIDEDDYNEAIDRSKLALIEGAQGFGLGIHRRFWPHTTSREVTPAQVLSDCALPLPTHYGLTVYGTLRTYPIRVANRYDADGKMIGTSGGCYPDQYEMEWRQLGRDAELTTVTRLPRRLFSFSFEQLNDALRICKPHGLFLNFANYMSREHALQLVDQINEAARPHGCDGVHYLGNGPRLEDVERL